MLDPQTDIHSDYLHKCFRDLKQVVDQTVAKLGPESHRFEGIVVRGTSGLLVGPMVASLLNKPWCVLRKAGDGSHGDYAGGIEGWFGFKTYIVIDDLVATGGTLKTIQQAMNDKARARGKSVECVGYYLYNWNQLVWRGSLVNHEYENKYFVSPEAPKRPAIPEQVAPANRQRPAFAYTDY